MYARELGETYHGVGKLRPFLKKTTKHRNISSSEEMDSFETYSNSSSSNVGTFLSSSWCFWGGWTGEILRFSPPLHHVLHSSRKGWLSSGKFMKTLNQEWIPSTPSLRKSEPGQVLFVERHLVLTLSSPVHFSLYGLSQWYFGLYKIPFLLFLNVFRIWREKKYPISWASWETPAVTPAYMYRVGHVCPR